MSGPALEIVHYATIMGEGERHLDTRGFSSKFELFLVIVRIFYTEYTLVDYRYSGSSHDDPPEPPKTPLLEDNSAPSLYPNTYTISRSEIRRGSVRERKVTVPYPSQVSVWLTARLASVP